MMTRFFTLGLAFALCAVLAAPSAQAVDIDVEATMTARVALTLNSNSDMEFGTVDYTAGHNGTITLGTNGSCGTTGTGLTCSGGTPAAGDVDVTGDGASTVDISCETGGVLQEDGLDVLTLASTEVVVNTGVASGAANACVALGTASTTADLSVDANPNILMGGTITAGAGAIAPAGNSIYTTTQAPAGDPVVLRVVYQ